MDCSIHYEINSQEQTVSIDGKMITDFAIAVSAILNEIVDATGVDPHLFLELVSHVWRLGEAFDREEDFPHG